MKRIFSFVGKFLLAAALIAPLWFYIFGRWYNVVLSAVINMTLPATYECVVKDSQMTLDYLYLLNPRETKVTLNVLTLHFNTIPFLALFLITPGVRLKRRLLYLLCGFILLSTSHVIHAKLDFTIVLNPTVTVTANDFSSLMMFLWRKLIRYLQAFMEQAGSMLMPFFLWLLFFNRFVFTLAKKAPLTRSPSPELISGTNPDA